MKKLFFVFLAFITSFSVGGCTVSTCLSPTEEKNISLSFDNAEAYFTGSVPLYPIAGETVADEDTAERAKVKLIADEAAYFQLKLVYVGNQEDIDGLMITVDGGNAVAVKNGITLYSGVELEKERTLDITLYLDKNASYTEAGRSLEFVFELSIVGEDA